MSYSEFPPPLSSSPPPLDALPPMPDEDEEDELGLGGPHSPTFDITGLSEKLPPTPKDSPIKALPSTSPYLPSIQAAATELCTSEAPCGTPDMGPISFHAREEVPSFGETVNPTNDDFGDFSNFHYDQQLNISNVDASDEFSGVESARSCNSYFESDNQKTKIVETSEDVQVSNQVVDTRVSSSHYINESNVECPPIPNNDLSIRKDLIIDQHRQIVNDKHYASDSDDESYHRFQKTVDLAEPSDDNIHSYDTSTECERRGSPEKIKSSGDLSKCTVSNESKFVLDCTSTTTQEPFSPLELTKVEASAESDFGDFASFGLEQNKSTSDLTGNSTDTVNQPVTEEARLSKSPIHGASNQETLQSSESFTDFGAFANFESTSANEPPPFVPAFEASFEPILGSSLPLVTNASLSTFSEDTPVAGFAPEVGVIADDVVMSCSLPTIEGATDVSPDADDDFGYRDIDAEEDQESDCEAGQTRSHREKREETVVVEAKNKLVKCAETQRSVDSNSGVWDHASEDDQKDGGDDEDDDDDFDDFVANTDAPVHDTDTVEFDEFATAKIDDAFGEFATNTRDGTKGALGSSFDDEDDDFGEFGTFSSGAPDAAVADTRKCSVTGLARGTSVDAGPGDGDPLLGRLESLVLKWIAVPAGTKQGDVQQQLPPQPLRDVVCGDAFVWRKLECVEWQPVVWSSSAAHQLMLTALNIDARNILYNQKWSSSVPLFAQSLSFSPLTPAKPSSMNSSSSSISVSSPRAQRQHQGLTPTVVPHSAPWSSAGGGGASNKLPSQSSTDEPIHQADGVVTAAADPPADSVAVPGCTANAITSESLDAFAAASLSGGSAEPRVPPPQFDWLASGLSNPLDQPPSSGDAATEPVLSGLSGAGAHPPLPTAVQQLLARCSATATSTPLDQLSEQERRFLQGLPDISFMSAKVLMFPIVGSTD